jgi:hypothetical protein
MALGYGGYTLGLKVPAKWWERVRAERGESGSAVAWTEGRDHFTETEKLVIAFLPLVALGGYLEGFYPSAQSEKLVAGQGWERVPQDSDIPPSRCAVELRHKYFKLYHRGV